MDEVLRAMNEENERLMKQAQDGWSEVSYTRKIICCQCLAKFKIQFHQNYFLFPRSNV